MADSLIRMPSSFVCLHCTKSKLSAMAARRKKKSCWLSELESVIIQDTTFFGLLLYLTRINDICEQIKWASNVHEQICTEKYFQVLNVSPRTPFYLFGQSKIKASAFELTWRKHNVECHAGDGKHRVTCRCGTPAANPIAGCHSQGLQSLVWQLLNITLWSGSLI